MPTNPMPTNLVPDRSSPPPARPLRRESEPSREHRLRSALMPWIAGIFTVALLSVVTIAWQRRDERALRDLPEGERRALYERTLQTLRGPCAPPEAPEGALLDHCRHEADLLRRFPECDATCSKLAARFLEQPSR